MIAFNEVPQFVIPAPEQSQPWLATGIAYGFAANAIGPRHMVTAKHTGLGLNATIKLNDGTTRRVTSVAYAPNGTDVTLLTVDADLPTWCSITPTANFNPTGAMFVGAGVTGTDEVRDPITGELRGWFWGSSSGQLKWINSNTRYARSVLERYEVGFEGMNGSFALTAGDSGGGYYVKDAAGAWHLQGIAVGIYSYNGSPLVDGKRVSQFRPAILPTVLNYQTSEMLMPRNWLLSAMPVAGDSDFNGAVDFGDLLRLAENYGKPATWSTGDYTGDGHANYNDLLALAQNFNAASGNLGSILQALPVSVSIGGQTIVPEPTTAIVSVLLPLSLSRRRRKVA